MIVVFILILLVLLLISIYGNYRIRKINEWFFDGILYASTDDEERKEEIREKYPEVYGKTDEKNE